MKYKLKLLFYSPVHIGEGGELEPFEYVIKDKYLHTFSFETFAAGLSREDREKLMHLQRNEKESSLKDIRNFIRHRVQPEAFLDKIRVTDAAARVYEDRFTDMKNMLTMDPFIKTMGCPYIPGSSLKGSIRTAVLNLWAGESNGRHRDEQDILKAKTKDRKGNFRQDIGLDVFKYLKVPDIPLGKGVTFFSKISNFHLKDNVLEETKIQLLREVTTSRFYSPEGLRQEDNGYLFDLGLSREIMKHSKAVTGRRDLTFDVIWKSLDFYERVLTSEAKKWSGYSGNLKRFYDSFAAFLTKERQVADVRVLKLGFGSGYDAVTIEKLRRPGQPHGKSINLVEGLSPLGWVILYRQD
jgi:CRISPR-associated protein Csm5